MYQLIEFESASGDKVYIEVSVPPTGGQQLAAADAAGLIGKATQSLEEALKPVPEAMKTVFDAITKSQFAPKELEVEFGLKFTADAGVVIGKIGSEASLNIKATWK